MLLLNAVDCSLGEDAIIVALPIGRKMSIFLHKILALVKMFGECSSDLTGAKRG